MTKPCVLCLSVGISAKNLLHSSCLEVNSWDNILVRHYHPLFACIPAYACRI